ncbi:MAG TPA: PEP-CTERM sorting domain-containing protein [Candidatus Omnitrophota bacterium]|nr:PEP-CTERM sorting domain-containing protein [Candidatus Omnitrophota bacterium]HPS19700.1 PEP-CTERM sorting domain-containing protein [Candidatus Omnitrophota bacterium]
MKKFFIAVFFIMVAVGTFGTTLYAEDYKYTTIAYDYNGANSGRCAEYPTGDGILLGGVPFSIPTGLNTWDSNTGSGTKTLTIAMNLYGVTEVDTLINTSWGYNGSQVASMTFIGSEGATYTKTFVGGYDIRDWYHGSYINSLSSPNSMNVYDNGWACVDKQLIPLPDEFKSQYLTSVIMSDWGAEYSSRTYLYGLTAKSLSTPEPVSSALFLLGGVSLAFARRKKNR